MCRPYGYVYLSDAADTQKEKEREREKERAK
jgi:hypothetical protein